jgi:two-component system chemotaxis sensor kinase CheA
MSNDIDIELNEMQEIVDDFLIEADELIESLDINLVKLESSPGDLDLLNEIFRAAHTIKGTSSFLGFEQVTSLTHKMEDILNKLRKSELAVTPSIMDVLLKSLDILKQLLISVRGGNKEEFDLTEIFGRLDAVLAGEDDDTSSSQPNDDSGASVGEEASSTPQAAEDSKQVDEVGGLEAESVPEQSKTKKATEQTIRVDVERLDALVNLTGEIVLGRNSLQQSLNRFNSENDGSEEMDGLNRAASAIDFITSELQLAVMKMRMQPIGKVFSRFSRQVRDLTRDSGKEIDLVVSGEATELDKSVIEEIGDPLMHIIRNSCDHGIELPEVREANGRNRRGTVKLSAFQEGSNIIIKVEDDGKGLDLEAIKSKAVERGLATQADVDRMPDREVFRFIFSAGFSTARVVTDVSGRGVGMDVVRSNIEKLNGLVELESAIGVGTTLTIKLPLTLAIVQGLLVESDDEVYVLPLSSVYETVRQEQANIYYINRRPVLRLRDEIIPIINLGEILRSNSRGFVMSEKPYVVIVGLADRKLGINIDRFYGQEEVVIKSLGQYLGATEGVAGATILGDGRIRLIVDLLGLFHIAGRLT